MVDDEPSVLEQRKGHGKLSALHVAAASGQIEVLCMLLDRGVSPDIVNRHKQTPLMLASLHGSIACVQKFIEAGANILMFDSMNGRTCLHYAAYYGHPDCLQSLLSAAQSTTVANSWGFDRFVNIRDGGGATPLHLAAGQIQAECVIVLLDSGALVCASTGGYRLLDNNRPLDTLSPEIYALEMLSEYQVDENHLSGATRELPWDATTTFFI